MGPAGDRNGIDPEAYRRGGEHPAVTVSIAKRKGADATRVTDAVKAKLENLQGRLIRPSRREVAAELALQDR